MNERAQMIKTAIMLELAKEGQTLQDLELHLQKNSMWLADPSKAWEAVKGLGGLGIASGLGLGALGGTLAYSGILANEDSTNQQMKKQKERQQYLEATRALQERMRNPAIL